MQQARLSTGSVLGERYLIIGQVGEGGMGRVYLAKDLKLEGKRWAVKETLPLAQLAEREQFMTEMKILCALDHPQLPKVVDYFPANDQGFAYTVMDYIEGVCLDQYVEQLSTDQRKKKSQSSQTLPVRQAVEWSIQLCDVLAYLHRQSPPIIHRDLKPPNVIVTEQQQLKLIDFGTSRRFRPELDEDTLCLGTIGFAAPEQYGKVQTDPRSDLYSLGALLYYLLTAGQLLGATQTIHQDHNRGTAISDIDSHVPSALIDLIEKATRYYPDQRYQRAEEMKQDLLLILRQLGESLPHPQAGLAFRSNVVERENISPTHNRVVVIGSLWSQTGSTTFGMNFCRALAARQVNVAYVEFPQISSYLYDYFNLENKGEVELTTGDWVSALIRQQSLHESAWRYKDIDWYLLNPLVSAIDKWTEELTLQLLYELRTYSVVIIDISTAWRDEDHRRLLKQADHVLLCAEPDPVRIDRFLQRVLNERNQTAEEVEKRSLAGLLSLPAFDLIAMKDDALIPHKLWKQFGVTPLVHFPYIPYPQLINKVWRSELIYDDRQMTSDLDGALQPLLKKFLSPEQLKLADQRRNGKRRFSFFR